MRNKSLLKVKAGVMALCVMGSLMAGECDRAFASETLAIGFETEDGEVVDAVDAELEDVEEETDGLEEQIITIKGSKYVADKFHGVKAYYRTGGNDGTNATYSCAAFVKRYYSEVYGVSVNNLLAGCTPVSSKGTIRKVASPKEGDIVATASGSGNHWAIVKNVNDNGTITLIEQNWKWQQDGKTLARVNRRVKASECKLYRLKK